MENRSQSSDLSLARKQGKAGCPRCSQLADLAQRRDCPVCGIELSPRKDHSLQRTAAWLITASILFFPANAWPIMRTSQLGATQDNTIVGGVLQLWHHGSYLVAGIIFVASIIVPIAKIISLAWLIGICSAGYRSSRRAHAKLFEYAELLGRWSMIDVGVAILVALVQLGGLLTIEAGPAGLAFAGVVISTMLAAHAFDPRLIWDAIDRREKEARAA